ncbi:MAG TPA: DUF302 domain-containing protein [Candidatus Acidoferrales bacterium]|nr:DUF302 domain-containing protein [Candidatus Acidoferrales bacterium]
MAITRTEVEHFTVISSRRFENVVDSFRAAVGQPDMLQFSKATAGAKTFAEFKKVVEKGLGRTDLMIFLELDQGAVLQKESGEGGQKIVRFITGNPLIMKEMVKHVPDAGAYAPVTVLIDERADGVHLSYDRMASFLAPYKNDQALAVARDLDSKVETLLREIAQ